MVDTVAKHLGISDNGTALRDDIFQKLILALSKSGLINSPINFTDKISEYVIQDDKKLWQSFKSYNLMFQNLT